MKLHRNACLAVCAAAMLFTAAALAQNSGSTSRQTTPQAREAGSGMASGRRQYKPVKAAEDKTLGSAHATESRSAEAKLRGKMGAANSNPMYKEDGGAGQNPLSDSKDKQTQPVHNGASEVIEYKDGDDPITHKRAGSQTTERKSGSIVYLDKSGDDSVTRHRPGKAPSTTKSGQAQPAGSSRQQ